MRRRTLHVAMTVALIACIASLLESALSRSRPCPLCGGRAEYVGALRSLSIDRTQWGRPHPLYRCRACEYDLLAPASAHSDPPALLELRPSG